MTEWGVVGVIIALGGLLGAAVKPIVTLTQTITKLTVVVEGLRGDLDDQRKSSKESHRRLWCHNEEQDSQLREHQDKLTEHETRIEQLERHG